MSHFYNQSDLKLTINQSQLNRAQSPPLPPPPAGSLLVFLWDISFSSCAIFLCSVVMLRLHKFWFHNTQSLCPLSAHNTLKQPISWLCDALICQCYAKLHLGIHPLNAITSNYLTNWEVKNSMLANYWIAKLQKTIILFLNVLKICFIQIPNESKILLSEGLIFLQPFFGVIIRWLFDNLMLCYYPFNSCKFNSNLLLVLKFLLNWKNK